MFLNIYSKGKYPADALSNFAPHPFTLDGVEIPCMECFLQSLKCPDPEEQKAVLTMEAKEAKEYGSQKPWRHQLYWQGVAVDRFSDDYRQLVERAYRAMAENPAFCRALRDSKRRILLHTIGKGSKRKTILTRREFLSNLYQLRRQLRNQ